MLAIILIALVLMAADDGRVDRYSDGLRIGSNGTKINLLAVGTVSVGTGVKTGTATVTGVDSGSVCILTRAEADTTTGTYSVACTTNTITVTTTDEPSTTMDYFYLVVDY